ncbi:uncharacterized protein BDR25DRAFT_394537 [Lindgomyces ingoldianus]|uniref:Uncharacterized protein n=1 Tax=Lindgomyces ingoldianus TaxID=673940 RepID=A0ACB6QRL5_9PLEO|nr:uncharacterized protein BDR25DRAFT_394537 [Lindgomyces ingoldianus]KAF2469208.1 hypothetical protein BDR25DRAFT_394537 [Lindgomyces ingoldianus]
MGLTPLKLLAGACPCQGSLPIPSELAEISSDYSYHVKVKVPMICSATAVVPLRMDALTIKLYSHATKTYDVWRLGSFRLMDVTYDLFRHGGCSVTRECTQISSAKRGRFTGSWEIMINDPGACCTEASAAPISVSLSSPTVPQTTSQVSNACQLDLTSEYLRHWELSQSPTLPPPGAGLPMEKPRTTIYSDGLNIHKDYWMKGKRNISSHLRNLYLYPENGLLHLKTECVLGISLWHLKILPNMSPTAWSRLSYPSFASYDTTLLAAQTVELGTKDLPQYRQGKLYNIAASCPRCESCDSPTTILKCRTLKQPKTARHEDAADSEPGSPANSQFTISRPLVGLVRWLALSASALPWPYSPRAEEIRERRVDRVGERFDVGQRGCWRASGILGRRLFAAGRIGEGEYANRGEVERLFMLKRSSSVTVLHLGSAVACCYIATRWLPLPLMDGSAVACGHWQTGYNAVVLGFSKRAGMSLPFRKLG